MFSGEIARVSCMCGGEEVAVSTYPGADEIDLAFWSAGRPSSQDPYDRAYKVRHILHIIKNGHPYVDMVELTVDEVEKLRDILKKAIEKVKLGQKERAAKDESST